MEPLRTFSNLSEAKQDRIIAVALEEFSEHGDQRTSINTIVRRLKIAKGSIFQYFGDKQGLFHFVFGMCLERVKDFLRGVRGATADEDLFARLEKTLMAGVRFINEYPLLYRLYLRVLFESGIPHRDRLLMAIRQYSHEFLRDLVEDAREKGELRADLDVEVCGFVLDAILDRFLQAQCIEHLDAGLGLYRIQPDKAQHWIAEIIRLLRIGIAAPSPRIEG